jgi:hypothetical protein
LILIAAIVSWLAVTPTERLLIRDRLVRIWGRSRQEPSGR